MRILLAAPTFGVYGGIEAFVLALADWLVSNTANEVRVCFKVVGNAAVAPELSDRCRSLKLSHRFVTRGSGALWRDIRWAEVVHCNTCSPDIALFAKLARRPLVLTIHNWFRGHRGWRNRLWYACSRAADWRTYNSAFVARTWEPDGKLRGSELIPTVSHLPKDTAPVARRRGFLIVARLIENKGLEVLIEAYARARIDREAWPLAIVGDGPLRSWLVAHLAEHRIAGVEVLGFVSEEEKARRIAHAMWLVAPANTKEDMGLTPIEARSVAVPAIVTRDGGLPESGGPSALLCAPGDVADLTLALERAASMSETEYRERAVTAQETLTRYLRPLSSYLAIYERLVAASV
jgi:glycosyltransferase involved in cell wall biosynthesis